MRTVRMVLAGLGALIFALSQPSGAAMTAEEHQAQLDRLSATMQSTIAQGPYAPTVESLNRYVVPDWYADAKLGIFIHYGLFSVPGYAGVGCWYGNNMYDPKSGAWAFHRENFGPQDQFGYKDFAPYLTASAFNADDWVSLFKDAGARFVVPVSCFHDGFAMWDSKLTDWNAVKTGPKRDYDRLIAAAARRQGLKFGVAWHAFFRPGFFGPGRREGTDIKPPDAGTPWSFYGPATVTPEFVEDGLGRLAELVDGYQPDLVWFDFDTQFVPLADLRRFAAFYFNRASEWKKGVAINDKHENQFPPQSIVLDFERGKASGLRPDLWQTDTSVSWRDWSYMRNDSFKTVDEIVREIVDIVSKNGVLLLDIGPRPDGSIPPEPQALLRGVGKWMKVNGEAIYGTRPCWALGFGEGPHNSGGGGFSDRAVEYNSRDFRFTQKGNVIYAVAMDWPDVDDHFLIRSINNKTILSSGGLTGIKLLGDGDPLDWKLTGDGLWIHRPAKRPCDGAFAFGIALDGISVEHLGAERINDRQVRIEVRVRNLDARPARQALTFFDNQAAIGTENIALRESETVTQTFVLDTPSKSTRDRISVGLANGNLFPAQAELISPPNGSATWKFDGEVMLAGKGLGKLGKLTLSLWTQAEEMRDEWTALLNTAGWDRGGMHVQYVKSGPLEVALMNSQGSAANGLSAASPGRAKGWQFITVTYDATAGQAVTFINGKKDAELAVSDAAAVNLDAFTLGGWTSGGRRFVGKMADVRIYDRVLSSAEIQALCDGQAISDGLVAAWDFKSHDGGTIRDTTGHGHDLTESR